MRIGDVEKPWLWLLRAIFHWICDSFWAFQTSTSRSFVGKIYVTGGSNFFNDYMGSCEKFDIASKQWTSMKKMSCHKKYHGMAAMNGAVTNHVCSCLEWLSQCQCLSKETIAASFLFLSLCCVYDSVQHVLKPVFFSSLLEPASWIESPSVFFGGSAKQQTQAPYS